MTHSKISAFWLVYLCVIVARIAGVILWPWWIILTPFVLLALYGSVMAYTLWRTRE